MHIFDSIYSSNRIVNSLSKQNFSIQHMQIYFITNNKTNIK